MQNLSFLGSIQTGFDKFLKFFKEKFRNGMIKSIKAAILDFSKRFCVSQNLRLTYTKLMQKEDCKIFGYSQS
jgi:hypothetical protein